ncbi:hypothetical protein LHK_02600 [Laribacter hongkongensis HLHK9]|uniref:DUF4376 domain-containing protein n=1 Tax=Laribacter hongkongensis (strain HLHK9) TaxID=557598 RepID=C1DBJ8_LARHH|nr:DUF4376 domain-containing protein [Laribacter hongkongensis]ACO73395.1 hypothetical protein LHK_00400 [Laribacter hongkongensis HLHK9]ACO75581.1 hypothetical protein LHK_02600 [Laribacter hongkongensis HLHK9]
MNFLIRFDETGRRTETHVVEEKTPSQIDRMVNDGFLIVPEPDYLLLIGNTTGKEHIRNPETGKYEEYVPPPPTLEALREQRRAEINRWRDEQENGGIEHAGHRWDTDEASLQRINAVLLSGTNPLGIWTSADNVDVPMTLEDMQGLFAAIVTRGSAIHARQREMKQAIEGMSRDELEAFQPGWPAP